MKHREVILEGTVSPGRSVLCVFVFLIEDHQICLGISDSCLETAALEV